MKNKFRVTLELDITFKPPTSTRPEKYEKAIKRWLVNYLKNVYIPIQEIGENVFDITNDATVTRIKIKDNS